MKEQRETDDPKSRTQAEAPDKAAPHNPAEPKKPAGLNYVFKIAPADPKNSFDFEDVADK